MKIEFISNTMNMKEREAPFPGSFAVLPTATILKNAGDKHGKDIFEWCVSFSFTIFELAFLFKKIGGIND